MKETSIVRENLMNEPNYSPYCGNPISRDEKDGCYNPRMVYRPVDGQFICPNCKLITKFPEEFITRYKAKWGLH